MSDATHPRPASPSSTDLWQRCQRWWAFKYIDGIPDPSSPKASLGTRCHTIAEAYLKHGVAPNRTERITLSVHGSPKSFYPGRIVANILHHLPPAASIHRTEEKLDFRYRGLDFTGIIDWQDDAHIGDHKFTSSLQYAKRPQDLLTDPQAVIYRTSRWLESDAKALTLQWTYGQFDAAASAAVKLPVVRDFGAIDALIPTIEAMQRARSDYASANDVPPTGLTLRPQIACQMFGGCPHLSRCDRPTKSITRGLLMSSSLLEQMRARRAGNGTIPGAETLLGTLTPTPQPQTPTMHTHSLPAPAPHSLPAPAPQPAQINPPGEANASLPASMMAPPPAVAAPAPAPDAPAPRKRGRPPKVPVAPAPSAPSAPSAPAPHPLPPVVPAAASAVPTTPIKIHTLYVDCHPIKGVGAPVDASGLISQAHSLVCEDQGVRHYKFLEYGTGPGALAVALGLVVDSAPDLASVVVSTRTNEGRDTAQCLIERSAHVVMGR